ncbi:MAG: arylsulfatase A [Rubritalea sp.]|jgi:arylsulfatase A
MGIPIAFCGQWSTLILLDFHKSATQIHVLQSHRFCFYTSIMKIILFALLATISMLKARDPLDKPNIIIIYLDDSGYGDFAHNGNPVIETPTISKMASNGANFTQFYVTTAACSASRYSLLTGRYPGRSGLGTWVVGSQAKNHIRDKEITIAEGLKANGYQTGMFGKWHLGSPNKKNNMSQKSLPLAHGFDRWVGTNVSHDYADAKLLKSDPAGTQPIAGYKELAINLPSDPEASRSLTKVCTDAAIAFINEKKEQPFLAYVAYNQPHLGLFVADEFKGKSRRGLLGDVMAEIDHSVGRILTTLEKHGIANNTLVIFSSDNGPWILFQDTKKHPKYGEARTHVGYAQPFRNGKGSTWEGGHRVPGIFYWPGVIAPNRQLSPASTLDILPTIFKLTGTPIPTDRSLDGRDISTLIAPQVFNTDVEPFELLYSHSRNKPSAIRQGPWKLISQIRSQLKDDSGFKASVESPLLFNVEQDLGECIDRASEYPKIVKRLSERLLKMKSEIEFEESFSE